VTPRQGCLITGRRLIGRRENGEFFLLRLPFDQEVSHLDFPFSNEDAKINVQSFSDRVVVRRLEKREVKTGSSGIPDTA
jgi:hypothetical protein